MANLQRSGIEPFKTVLLRAVSSVNGLPPAPGVGTRVDRGKVSVRRLGRSFAVMQKPARSGPRSIGWGSALAGSREWPPRRFAPAGRVSLFGGPPSASGRVWAKGDTNIVSIAHNEVPTAVRRDCHRT